MAGISGEWYRACELVYAQGSTENFWRADALLTSLERLTESGHVLPDSRAKRGVWTRRGMLGPAPTD
jgi:hypothetical protein